jgi:regulator of protease activity HflC (stomatin/prohibitin superfamily)
MATSYTDEGKFNIKKWVTITVGVILIIVVAASATRIFENVPADEVVVIQSPISGDLTWYTTPGLKWQGFGKVTSYRKSFQYWFSSMQDQGKKLDQSIETRFNDGGHAKISGSVRVDLPMDSDKLTALHTRYGSQESIEQELIRPSFERSIYMSGPLMSSAESYSERRNQLINFIEDQAVKGMYKTTTRLVRTKDPITGSEKTINVVDLVMDPKAPGGFQRSETSPIVEFGMKSYNLSINNITYDKEVDQQIKTQQRAIMQVQTAIAESRQAEQKALTAEQEGKAEATKTRWAQEAIKAKMVTEGEQKKEVARLSKEASEFYKQEQILRGEGDAEYKKLVMDADGALSLKLEAYKSVMGDFAREFGKQKWVPEIILGGSNDGANQAANMMNLLSVQALKTLGLDVSIPTKSGETVKRK